MEKLVRAIEDFKAEAVKVDGIGNEAGSCGVEVLVSDLADPDLSRGQCDWVAADFEAFARARGFEARGEMFGSPSHTASIVVADGREFLVDFTASQFEADVFPFVAERRSEELSDEELEELEDTQGYAEWAPHDPYMSFDFIAAYRPL